MNLGQPVVHTHMTQAAGGGPFPLPGSCRRAQQGASPPPRVPRQKQLARQARHRGETGPRGGKPRNHI
eukprot:6108042-Alexandrium_andersonii.AAC.1